MKTTRKQVIEETNLGVYVWAMPDGRPVGDDEGHFLNIPSVKGDQTKIELLRSAARHYGVEEGRPVFLPGRRRVTDEEFEEQKARQAAGLVPDPYDVAALKEQAKYGRHFNS